MTIRRGSGLPHVSPDISPADIEDAQRVGNRDASSMIPAFDATLMPEAEQDGPIPDIDHGAA